ncbi:MAG: carboxypeptidase M32 [Anaerolineales bacterium]|jgi:carboxypeptidase Taq
MGEALEQLRDRLGEIADLMAASEMVLWDQQIYMPRGGGPAHTIQLARLELLIQQEYSSDDLGSLLEGAGREVAGHPLDSDEASLVRVAKREYDRRRRIPPKWSGEFARVLSVSRQVWERARDTSDFELFRPHLERVVAMIREYANFFAPYDSPYDPVLDNFEPGLKTAKLLEIYATLRPALRELLGRIQAHAEVVPDPPQGDFNEREQWNLGIEVLHRMGFDFERGRQDCSAHPFTTALSPSDVRITTQIHRDLLTSALLSTIHEGGHGLYEQGVDPGLARTPLAGGASTAMHESQSRLWENMVGRSRSFWRYFLPALKFHFPQLEALSAEGFYRAMNRVTPSCLRTEADEVTYQLHVILRFELERGLLDGSLAVKDLPGAWNEGMRQDLGVLPPNDAQGVLQDGHWSSGDFGYFPCYTVGDLISVQIFNEALAQEPQISNEIESGNFLPLLSWLRENIYKHGAKFEAEELVRRVTGLPIQVQPYLRYLQSKFGDIYGFAAPTA